MAMSSPVSPRDLALKEKRFQSIEEIEAAYNVMVKRLNDVYKYNRRDHDRLTEDVEDVSEGGTLAVEEHTSDDTLTVAESGSIHTNLGATGTITLTLPASAPKGTWFTFATTDTAYQLRVHPGSAKLLLTIAPPAGTLVYSYNLGRAITFVSDSNGDWIVVSQYGSWAVL